MIHLILLSGGSGTRLWPLSNNTRSKQFLKVLRDIEGNPQSMVQRVFAQISEVPADIDITIATTESQALSISQQIDGDYELVLEPERRDTFPAIALSCASIIDMEDTKPNDTIIVMPIDTFADQAYYDLIANLDDAVEDGIADLVLLGVEPTYPSEKYGYIVPENTTGNAWPVKCFIEKPTTSKAEELISSGALWNCGVFAFRVGYIEKILKKYFEVPTFETARNKYNTLPKISFDYEVVEKADSVAVVPYSGTWKDLGTWNTLTEEMADTVSGRVVIDDTSCDNTHVVNETGLPLVVAGIQDAVVVATHDGILVSDKEKSAAIKSLVEKAAEARPMYEQRHWGEYRVLDSSVYPNGEKALTKELIIKPGCQLSYQQHNRRSEVWTIVSGQGQVVLNGAISPLRVGSVVTIDKDTKHALYADTELHIIEVQLGDLLEERDIERYGFFWEGK